VDLPHRLPVRRAHDVDADLLRAVDDALDPRGHVDVLEDDELPLALAQGLHRLVLVDGLPQADGEDAVNESVAPVCAWCARRIARGSVTSTSSKPCIAGLWRTDQYAAAANCL
jgi:hypothetical protein